MGFLDCIHWLHFIISISHIFTYSWILIFGKEHSISHAVIFVFFQPLYFASVPEDSNDMENRNEAEIPIQQNETASSSSADGCLLPATDDAQAKSIHKASISSPAYSRQGLEAHQRRKKHTDNSVQDLNEASSTDCRLLGSYNVENSRPTMGAAAAGETLDITYLSHVGDPNYSHDFPDCIVCQTQRLTCVLLPCRHACVCRRCFVQLDRCPMCRSHVESYFLIGDEQSSSQVRNQEEDSSGLLSKFESFNNRLNEFFGFS